jgi:hypothetical protein
MDLSAVAVLDNGIIDLGCNNRSAIIRLANWAQSLINTKQPPPKSPFCQWAAKRVTDSDKQDLTIFISSRKGKGKSYTALGLATHLADEIALILGGKSTDYFTIENCALLMDSGKITKLLSTKGNNQVLLIDDAGVGANNREFLSRGNINFNKIMMTCRTKRWIVIFTSVLKSHVDLNIREMSDVLITIYKSFHNAGFNICKAKSSDVIELPNNKNVTISKRLSMHDKKIDFWVSFGPSKEMAEEYDKQRDAAADLILKESSENINKKEMGFREIKGQEMITKYLDKVKEMLDHGDSERKIIKACEGLTPTYLTKIRQHGGF